MHCEVHSGSPWLSRTTFFLSFRRPLSGLSLYLLSLAWDGGHRPHGHVSRGKRQNTAAQTRFLFQTREFNKGSVGELISRKERKKKKVKLLSRVQLFATPWTVAYQAPLSMGFSRQESWSGVPFSLPGCLPYPGIQPGLLHLLRWQADSLPLDHLGSPSNCNTCYTGPCTRGKSSPIKLRHWFKWQN